MDKGCRILGRATMVVRPRRSIRPANNLSHRLAYGLASDVEALGDLPLGRKRVPDLAVVEQPLQLRADNLVLENPGFCTRGHPLDSTKSWYRPRLAVLLTSSPTWMHPLV